MVRQRRMSVVLQVSVLVVASLLEVAANFAANDVQSGTVRALVRFALPAVAVLLLLLVAGNVLVFRMEHLAADRPAWDPGRPPYPGLAAFDEGDAAVYFGRESQIADLIQRLHTVATDAESRFVCVTGASGSGKSSLVHAGVVSRLRGRRWTVLPVVIPAGEPLDRLAAAFAQQSAADPREVLQRLSDGEPVSVVGGSRFGRVLLVVDQLEELVTLSGIEQREEFFGVLARALAADRRLWVLATLRVEFLPELVESAHARLLANPVVLGALRPAELVAVIERPAVLSGLVLEPGLVADAVEDTGAVDALPLLAYLLQELYLGAGAGGVVTRQAYRALGGVAGALARQADAVFTGLAADYGADTVLATLLLLVGMDGGEPTRRRVLLGDLSPVERAVVAAFTDARLLVTDSTAPVGGAVTVQVAHEALFRQWPPLRQHVAAQAEHLRGRSELERWTADWEGSGRSADYLLTGDRLALAGRWLEVFRDGEQVAGGIKALIAASRGRDTAYLRQISEAIGRNVLANVEQDPQLGILLTVAALTECPPTPTAVRALMASMTHSHATHVLTGHTASVRAVAWSPDGSRLASASRDGSTRIWDAATGAELLALGDRDELLDAVAWSPDCAWIATCGRGCPVNVFDTRTGMRVAALELPDFTRDLAFSPDGTRLAAASRDRVIRIFDTLTWRTVVELIGHGNEVWGVAWSPDGRRLASVSHDKTAIVWDAETGAVQRTFTAHTRLMQGVGWSPDGTRIIVSSSDGKIMTWDVAEFRLADAIAGYRDTPSWIRWSPDGRRIAFVCGDRTARIWDAERDAEVAVLRGHGDIVWSASWSPDGTRIVTGSEDATVRVWYAAASGAELARLSGHDSGVRALSVSSDGLRLASAAYDGVRVWDLTTGRQLGPSRDADEQVRALAWSPDGHSIVTSGDDAVIRVRHVESDEERVTLELPALAEAIVWSPDSTRLAVSSRDSLVRVLDARTGIELSRLVAHTDWTAALAWSPDGSHLASGSDDRTARIWDLSSAEAVHTLVGHQNWIDGVAWSPDGKYLASCSADWTIRIWNAATGRLTDTLTGHEQRVRAIAWSPDGTRLASVSNDCTVRVWRPEERDESTVIGVHRQRVRTVAWLPDGRRVITGSIDATIRVWQADVDLDSLLRTARRHTFRALTAEERRTHLLPDER
jgi:WD40 repeat protein